MHKRQDVAALQLPKHRRLILTLFLALWLSACLPQNINKTANTQLATNTSLPAITLPTKKTEAPPATAIPKTPAPSSTPNCRTSGGKLQKGDFYSQYLQDDFHYQVYLPPCYDPSRDVGFPVVYLLHGLSYDNQQWLQLGLVDAMDALIAEGTIPPYMIVLPQETRFSPPQISLFPDALALELIPWIDTQYHTLPDKSYRAIGGLSRGAAWAVHIAFTFNDVFSSVGAHSLPLFEADGGKVIGWLTQQAPQDLPTVFIDIGRGDRERYSARDFADQLDEFGIPHEWTLFNGGHTESYWSSHLRTYLRWYGRNW